MPDPNAGTAISTGGVAGAAGAHVGAHWASRSMGIARRPRCFIAVSLATGVGERQQPPPAAVRRRPLVHCWYRPRISPRLPSPEERRAIGRAARSAVPRDIVGDWEPAGRGHDALQTVLAQNAGRAPDLLPIRHGRMAASPWTYFRGAAAVMAADLASRPNTGLGPVVRGRPRPQLRLVGHAGAAALVRPARLRRDAARTVRVGRDADAGQPPGARTQRRPRPPQGPRPGAAGRARGVPVEDRRLRRRPLPRHLVRPDHRRGPARPVPSTRSGRTGRPSPQAGAEAFQRRGGEEVQRGRGRPAATRRGRRRSASTTPCRPGMVEEVSRRIGHHCPRSGATCSIATPSSTWCGRWSASAASACGCSSCCCGGRARTTCCSCRSSRPGRRCTRPSCRPAPTPTTANG